MDLPKNVTQIGEANCMCNIKYPLKDNGISNQDDFNFICGVIETSMVLRNSDYKGTASYASAYELAKAGAANNKYREEFASLIKKLG